METNVTVEVQQTVVNRAARSCIKLRTHQRADGTVGYEAIDELSGKLLGRSRNFAKINAHINRLSGAYRAR